MYVWYNVCCGTKFGLLLCALDNLGCSRVQELYSHQDMQQGRNAAHCGTGQKISCNTRTNSDNHSRRIIAVILDFQPYIKSKM